MAAPLIEAADCTESGNNTASTSWAVSFPNASTGDLLLVHIAWDDSTTTTGVTAPAGPNGESFVAIGSVFTDSGTTVRGRVGYYVATGSWTAGTRTFTPSASEQWTAVVARVPAGEFDSTTPIGASNTTSLNTAASTMPSPTLSAGASDGGGRVVFFASIDTVTTSATPSGWTMRIERDRGAVGCNLSTRDAATTNSESIASADWTLASADTAASMVYIVRGAPQTLSGSGTPTLPLITSSGAVNAVGPGGGEAAPLPHFSSLFAASGATFSGSGSASLPLPTASGSGTKARKGSGTPSLPLITAAGSGTKARKGSGSPSLPLPTASGAGKRALKATGASSLPLITASGSGTKARNGAGTPSLPLVTATGSGTKARKGSGTPSLPLITATGSGKKARPGTGTASLPLLTASGSGSVAAADEWTGSGSPSLPLLTATGSGSRALKGTGTSSLPLIAASGTGTKARKGTGAPSLPLPTATGTGKRGLSSTGTPSLPLLTATGTGSAAASGGGGDPAPLPHLGLLLAPATGNNGSGSPSLPVITASGSGEVVRLPVSSIQTITRRNRPGRGPYSLGKYCRPPLRGDFTRADGTSHSGSGSPSLPLITASGSAKRALKSTGTATLPLVTAAGLGTKSRKGSGTPSLPLITASGSGKKARSGTGSSSLPLITASGSGAVTEAGTFSGSGASSLPLLTASGSAKRSLKATGAASLPLVTASGTGKRALFGSGSASLPLVTASGSGVGPQTEEPSGPGGSPPSHKARKKVKDWLEAQITRKGSGEASLPVLEAFGEGFVVRKIERFTPTEIRPVLSLPKRKKVVVPEDIDAQIARELRYAEELENQKRKRRRKQDEEILLLL